ncbi:hypothetical protein JJL45_14020 [Tamlana sp. s12]|uniref:hypothetical protein n=1 Tax=Tamlana sp. s12 TaxID=1630406 RepID=UPI000801AF4B|nr:hypothetical protein [Tamlana sp. s12]OBQ56356.1 hypothetical protein VQ01_03085 [Tamlana sp. s12]QQY82026.1 hypothetical protein JJL45_14020 [Tamlana sp. s12]
MKKIQVLIILFILSSCSSLKYLDAYDGFKDKPKEVEVITFRVTYPDSLPKEVMSSKVVYFYDTIGRMKPSFCQQVLTP